MQDLRACQNFSHMKHAHMTWKAAAYVVNDGNSEELGLRLQSPLEVGVPNRIVDAVNDL
jgi:hypothetical protein